MHTFTATTFGFFADSLSSGADSTFVALPIAPFVHTILSLTVLGHVCVCCTELNECVCCTLVSTA